jgi:hypothetical protein
MEVLLLTTSFIAFLLTQSAKNTSSVLQPLLSGRNSVMLKYVLGSSQKIGGPNKTVEIDDSKFGRRKYNWGNKVKGQRVFSGVERKPGKPFLVPVPDRTADNSMAIISD